VPAQRIAIRKLLLPSKTMPSTSATNR
jgi:hypothetical protein